MRSRVTALRRAGSWPGSEPPVPFEGLLLAWADGDSTGRSAHARARRFAADSAYRADALADRLAAAEISAAEGVRRGAKGGGFPGHLAFAAWAQAPDGTGGRAAVLILSDLPMGLFYHLSRTGLGAALVLRLLASPTRDAAH